MSSQIEINSQLVNYLQNIGYRSDTIINSLVEKTKSLGNVAEMQIAPEQGQLLQIIVSLLNAKNCLEIGRFTGLSTLSIARGLPEGGKIISVDNSDEFLSFAKDFWNKANVINKIESIIGNGVDIMQSFIDRQFSFDFIFIDADKNNYQNYYELSLSLLASNGVIVIDNMLWGGKVANLSINDSQTEVIRLLNEKIQNDQRIEFSLLPLSDGLSLIRKK